LSLQHSSDDDEEEAVAASEPKEAPVKTEESEAKIPKAIASSTELHAYTEEELEAFNRKGLLADMALLEGKHPSSP